MIEEAAVFLNEDKRTKEMMVRAKDLQERMSEIPPDINLGVGKILKEGIWHFVRDNADRSQWIILLDTMVIIADRVSLTQDMVPPAHTLRFVNAIDFHDGGFVRAVDRSGFPLMVMSARLTVACFCETEKDRASWISAVARY